MVRLYCVTCRSTGRMYVGITSGELDKRWRRHAHESTLPVVNKFHAALQQYGPEDFDRVVLFAYPSNPADEDAEAHLIAALNLVETGYNTLPGGGISPMLIPEIRAKAKAAQRNRSPEWRARQSAAHKGKRLSQETKDKIAAAHTGRVRSPEEIAKSPASRRGQRVSDDQRNHLSRVLKGRVNTPEQLARHSVSMRAYWQRRREDEALAIYS